MTDLILLQKKNDERWKTAKVTERLPVDPTAQRLFSNKARYLKIVHMLQALGSNMPDEAWVFIAATHERESGGNFVPARANGGGDGQYRYIPATVIPNEGGIGFRSTDPQAFVFLTGGVDGF